MPPRRHGRANEAVGDSTRERSSGLAAPGLRRSIGALVSPDDLLDSGAMRVARLTGLAFIIATCSAWLCETPAMGEGKVPNILIVTIDTLRADRLSGYGYRRNTSPRLDELMARGARFAEARTVEPLTAPALASMVTSLEPHLHAGSRNGLKMRPGLPSFVKILRRRGYVAAAFVGNWTLRDKISGQAEHFDSYNEVFTRKRWAGLFNAEATGADINEQALDWLKDHRRKAKGRPFLLWVHYVEPHAPYVLQKDHLDQLGLEGASHSQLDRYDTEVAYVDARAGELVAGVEDLSNGDDLVVVLTADHGESLGEHGYWGHGRHLYEVSLRIPLAILYEGRIAPRVVTAPALIVDIPRTILGLVGLPALDSFGGIDWSPVLTGAKAEPLDRAVTAQAHKGAVQGKGEGPRPRTRGLLEVARIAGPRKEILRVTNSSRWLFDLVEDPVEMGSLAADDSPPSAELQAWLEEVRAGLAQGDQLPPPDLDDEDTEKLRALGYVD